MMKRNDNQIPPFWKIDKKRHDKSPLRSNQNNLVNLKVNSSKLGALLPPASINSLWISSSKNGTSKRSTLSLSRHRIWNYQRFKWTLPFYLKQRSTASDTLFLISNTVADLISPANSSIITLECCLQEATLWKKRYVSITFSKPLNPGLLPPYTLLY